MSSYEGNLRQKVDVLQILCQSSEHHKRRSLSPSWRILAVPSPTPAQTYSMLSHPLSSFPAQTGVLNPTQNEEQQLLPFAPETRLVLEAAN